MIERLSSWLAWLALVLSSACASAGRDRLAGEFARLELRFAG